MCKEGSAEGAMKNVRASFEVSWQFMSRFSDAGIPWPYNILDKESGSVSGQEQSKP